MATNAKAKSKDKSDAPIGNPASAWREWKAREAGAAMQMDVDLVETSTAVHEKQRQKGKEKDKLQHKTLITVIGSDVEITDVGGRGINVDSSRKGENMKGKGKVKLVRIDEDVEMGGNTFVVPTLPTQGNTKPAMRKAPVAKCSNQNAETSNPK